MKTNGKTFFAGSFDPFTLGHLDIVKQAAKVFDNIIIGIGISECKVRRFDRFAMQKTITQTLKENGLASKAECVVYDGFTGEKALQTNCTCLMRGKKNNAEDKYEIRVEEYNKKNYDLDTIYFYPSTSDFSKISSTYTKELLDKKSFNELKGLVPSAVFKLITKESE